MSKVFPYEKHVVNFFWDCLKPFKSWLAGLFIVTICLALSALLKPYALGELINSLAGNDVERQTGHFAMVAVLYMLASLFPVIAFRIHNFISVKLNPGLRHRITALSMESVMGRPYGFFQDHAAANIANTIKEIGTTIPDFIKTTFDGLICGLLTLAMATAVMWSVNYKFALGLIVWIALYFIVSIYILKRAKKLGHEGIKIRSKILAKVIEIIENIKCIRLLTNENFEKQKLRGLLNQFLKIDEDKEKCTVKTFAFQGFSFVLFQGFCLWWLFDGYQKGEVQIGDFALILTINLSFVDYFRKVTQHLLDFADLLGNMHQGIKLIAAPTVKENNSGYDVPLNEGEIVFNNVTFNYSASVPLFQDKSVHIKAGEIVGIIGHSGSGKSTFINLLLRLYDVKSGNILIDQHNIEHLSYDCLRKSISVVPQAPSLFSGTLMENIRYGRTDASDLEVIEAAKQADIHDYILSLPQGYETKIDSFGVKLSAGQRQRIAIARAVLKDARILVLDEAMSHLDTVTEGKIQNSLLKLITGKTTILVTHRPSSLLLHAHHILVFEKGKIVEKGSHHDLRMRSSRYQSLWDSAEKFIHP